MGTALEGSKISYRKWAWAIYMCVTNLKGVSSMKLHRDLGVSQPTAWFMLHRLRETWAYDAGSVRRPGGSGRDLHGRQGAEQACEQAAERRSRAGRQDGGGWV